tara:strand:+ start:60 stop:632 length:573 start_codon:yes stop_codon:yes gene_type:complete
MERYTATAIALHWLIAVAILLQLGSGLWMGGALKDPATQAFAYDVFQWHKALGLSVLVLSLFRLIWRVTHRPPALPPAMPMLERRLAHLGHWALYALMIAIPLSGWVMVSTSKFGLPTSWFGLFEWPHLPVPKDMRTSANDGSHEAHWLMAYAMIGLLIAHISAALRHHFLLHDTVLWRMLPVVKRKESA